MFFPPFPPVISLAQHTHRGKNASRIGIAFFSSAFCTMPKQHFHSNYGSRSLSLDAYTREHATSANIYHGGKKNWARRAFSVCVWAQSANIMIVFFLRRQIEIMVQWTLNQRRRRATGVSVEKHDKVNTGKQEALKCFACILMMIEMMNFGTSIKDQNYTFTNGR